MVECLAYYVVGMTNYVVLVLKSVFRCDADVLVRHDYDNHWFVLGGVIGFQEL